MTEFESQILYFFDKSPTRAQIRSLASMYGVKEDNIIDILKQYGREIPEKKRGPKPKVKTEHPKAEERELIIKMPDCVANTIEKRMHELEADIKNYQEAINNYQDMVNRLEAEYKAHADYLLNCPFEQRNLSQSCSDNMIESPQP
jgi:ssDNA-binding Zn-finger/Zn-ribbon topoisomerase 1